MRGDPAQVVRAGYWVGFKPNVAAFFVRCVCLFTIPMLFRTIQRSGLREVL